MTNDQQAPADVQRSDPDWQELHRRAGTVFTPAVPVSEKAFFAGRMEQIRRAVDAINQRGLHVIIYGERGVGKTSLANILASRIEARVPVLSPRVNCDSTDSFASLWQKALTQVNMIRRKRSLGFRGDTREEPMTADDTLDEPATPDAVRRVLARLAEEQIVVIIFDEFDRVTNESARRAMADTIKALSDHDIRATIVIVGVADTVGGLIAEHRSIERALAQIPMPRMARPELEEILTRNTAELGMAIDDEARNRIATLAQGLPHYVQLLGLHAARHALDSHRLRIDGTDVLPAMVQAVEQAQQSLQDDYRLATSSPQKGNLYSQVLLACSLAPTDEFGYFAASDVREPLTKIMGKRYDIPRFARHLNDFCQPTRGGILRKSGRKHQHFYRFDSPLMQPLVIMKGMIDGRIPHL